jgi:GNAT superfamily N-acetyltransferase
MIEIRRAGAADARSLGRLRSASMIELGYLEVDERARFERRASADMARQLHDGRLVAWVLCDCARVVGSACATFFERLPYPDGALHAEVAGVYVEPSFRGHGHASRLVEAVLAEVRAAGVRRTFLRPSPRSKPLYARLGFTEDDGGLMRLSGAGRAERAVPNVPAETCG